MISESRTGDNVQAAHSAWAGLHSVFSAGGPDDIFREAERKADIALVAAFRWRIVVMMYLPLNIRVTVALSTG
jgi:hypothetical protein